LSCLCTLIDKYALFCILFANWYSPAALTEVYPCFFLSCKANARGIPHKDGARSPLFLISELCCSMYCLCVNVYCTTATRCQPKCSSIYHITSYHFISYFIYHIYIISFHIYHFISYHFIYIISYHIYHIISYHIISYHIIPKCYVTRTMFCVVNCFPMVSLPLFSPNCFVHGAKSATRTLNPMHNLSASRH